MSFVVRDGASTRDELKRPCAYLLDRATTVEDLAGRALGTIIGAVDSLGRSPFVYREAGSSPFLREPLIPFGSSGCVALFS